MQYNLTITPKKTVFLLTLIVIFLTLAGLAVQIGKYVYNYREEWTRFFNLDREFNLPSFYAALSLLFCSLLLNLIAHAKQSHHEPFVNEWKILGIIFSLLALDEFAAIHEILIIPDLAEKLNLPDFLRQIWIIPAFILVIIFIWKYFKFTLHLPRLTRFLFILAALFYIGGALGMEMIGSYFRQQSLGYALLTVVEEVMEMIGVIIFIYGLLRYLRKYHQSLQINLQFFETHPHKQRHI